MKFIIPVIQAGCVAVNIPGCLEGDPISWMGLTVCSILLFITTAVILRD